MGRSSGSLHDRAERGETRALGMGVNSLGRGVWLTAAGVVVLLISVAGRYGFHRDELYFVVAGRRLDWGYVDQPPLTPLIARISETLGGTSPVAIRVLPALAIGGVILLTAAIARRFGAGARGQLFAAIAAGGAGFALAVGHLLSTATFDYFLWTAAIWLLIGLLDGDDERRWVALGLVVGIGMQNKHLIGLLAVAVLASVLATAQRKVLAGIWPWVGASVAIVIALPNLLWQLSNDFPQLEMARALAERSDGPVAFVLEQVGLLDCAGGSGSNRMVASRPLAEPATVAPRRDRVRAPVRLLPRHRRQVVLRGPDVSGVARGRLALV
jgi:4-amino-4-deoxy-L-arabinose transferase-like glycosyltransferase